MDEKDSIKIKALSNIAAIDISLEFDEILHNILKITCETMNAQSGTIMLVDEYTNELKMVSSYGLPENYIENVYAAAKKAGVQLTSSPSGAVLKTGKYYAVSNLFKEPKARPWYHLGIDLGITAQIFTPMKRRLKVIGLLNVYMSEIHDFTDEEIDFVTIAASQASSVVQNAKMCRRLKDNIGELNHYKQQLEDRIKQTHAKLFESEKYLRTIIESSLDGILVLDNMGRFEFGNESVFNILRWPREELIGHFFMKVIPKDMSEFMMERWQEVQNGMGKPYETKIITKKHELRNLYVSHSPTFIQGKKKYVVVIKDISEEKKLEICLKESEAKYRDLFENAEDPMYTIDNKGFFKTINNSFCGILGATMDEIMGTNISIWLTPESLETAKQRIKKHNSSENVNEPVVYELICKNGEHKWVEIRTRPLKEGDRITGIHGIGRDITEKIKIEQQLIESEVKYRELFENANDGIYTHDINGFFLTINDAGCKILECDTKNEIIGTHLSKWLTWESLELATEFIKNYVSGEKVKQPIILELITKNKKHLFVEFRNRLIKDKDRIIAIHGIARDITEKIILENKIKESELKYRDLFENAQDPMFVVDTAGHFLKINKACLEIIGCSLEELKGSLLSKWITPESLKVYLERRAACFSNKYRKPMETFELICKNGEHRWVEVKTRAIKIENNITEIHCIARDITEKTRLEQKVKEYHEKLERSYSELLESDRIKAEFISNITHELLTPLTSIRGFVELLDDETMGKINPEQKKSLEIILRNSDRLIRLIKELLDASDLENNKLGMQFRLISLNNILSKSVQDIYPQAKDKQIMIIKHIEQLPEIWGDEERLIQVITNLLINAIKFTDENGKITVRAADDKENVRISITDTGIGIPANKLKIIFDKFYQVDGSSSRKYGGVGIGLSVCKSIINKHYGSIWAESDGHGSTFYISIPKLKINTGEKNV